MNIELENGSFIGCPLALEVKNLNHFFLVDNVIGLTAWIGMKPC